MFANTPKPPYYAVIFTSTLSDDQEGYQEMAEKMLTLAAEQDGFLGVEGARQDIGITVSYWRDLAAIATWKANSEHVIAQQLGRKQWYQAFTTRIAKEEREYHFESIMNTKKK